MQPVPHPFRTQLPCHLLAQQSCSQADSAPLDTLSQQDSTCVLTCCGSRLPRVSYCSSSLRTWTKGHRRARRIRGEVMESVERHGKPPRSQAGPRRATQIHKECTCTVLDGVPAASMHAVGHLSLTWAARKCAQHALHRCDAVVQGACPVFLIHFWNWKGPTMASHGKLHCHCSCF